MWKAACWCGAMRTRRDGHAARGHQEFYGGNAPKVLDPFAGGGAIPLEAMRLGCEVTSADLNPVAWFIQKCTLDYPQRFAGKKWPLPEFVREWPDFVEDFIAGKIKKRKGDKKPHFNDEKQYSFDNPAKPATTAPPDALNAAGCRPGVACASMGTLGAGTGAAGIGGTLSDSGWRANRGLLVGAHCARSQNDWPYSSA